MSDLGRSATTRRDDTAGFFDGSFGFEWGPMVVTRLAYVEGRGYSLEVRTKHQVLQVYVSERGRRIQPMAVRDA